MNKMVLEIRRSEEGISSLWIVKKPNDELFSVGSLRMTLHDCPLEVAEDLNTI